MIWDIIAGFGAGLIGAMGLGGGAVLLIYLTLFKGASQLAAQGLNLLFFIPIALISVIIYAVKKQIKPKTILLTALFGIGGTPVGVWLSQVLGSGITAKIFGGMLAVGGVCQIVNSFLKKDKNS